MTNNELDKQWLNECRASMQNFEAPAPADGWASIAASVGAEATPSVAPQVKPAPVVPLRAWLWRAAAILLLLLLVGGGVWLGLSDGDPVSPDFREPLASVPATPEDWQPSLAEGQEAVEPATSEPQPTANPKPARPVQKASRTPNRQPLAEAKSILPELESSRSHSEAIPKDEATAVNEQTASSTEVETVKQEPARQNVTTDYADSLMHSEEAAVLQEMERALQGKIACLDIAPRPRWSVSAGLGVGGNGTASQITSNNTNTNYSGIDKIHTNYMAVSGSAPAFLTELSRLEPSAEMAAFNKAPLPVPELPKANEDEVQQIDNHMSVTLGATMSYRLKERLAIVSGLTYTKLSSDVKCTFGSYTQELYYLGVPLSVQYTVFGRGRWQCYASSGTMGERLLRAERGDEKLSMPDWQWSVNTAVGVQFQFARHWGLYAEPNLSYFFDNGSDVPTYRTEHPCCFSVQAGIRLIY
ncbi:MAG: hypothetical protein J6Y99_06920 [Bacteroidales bacterium]|nr:hypothetical protein [Bacteroidales bacterium]